MEKHIWTQLTGSRNIGHIISIAISLVPSLHWSLTIHSLILAMKLRRHLPVLVSNSLASRSLEPRMEGADLTNANSKSFNQNVNTRVMRVSHAQIMFQVVRNAYIINLNYFLSTELLVRTQTPSKDIEALSTGAEWSGNSCKPDSDAVLSGRKMPTVLQSKSEESWTNQCKWDRTKSDTCIWTDFNPDKDSTRRKHQCAHQRVSQRHLVQLSEPLQNFPQYLRHVMSCDVMK